MQTTGWRVAAVTAVFFALVVSSSSARSQEIGVFPAAAYPLNSNGWCDIATVNDFYDVNVVFYSSPYYQNGDYKEVRFALSLPTQSGYLFDAWVLGQGNVDISALQSGLTVPLGSCQAGPTIVAKFKFWRLANPPGQNLIRVVPDPGASSGMVEFTRCDDEKVYVIEGSWAGNVDSGQEMPVPLSFTPPSNPSPPDGATNVDPDTRLFALVHPPAVVFGCAALIADNVELYLGTTPNPPKFNVPYLQGWWPYDMHLQPGTTYYWRVKFDHSYRDYSSFGPAWSPVWSFTTTAPVTTRATTWGAIKALYR